MALGTPTQLASGISNGSGAALVSASVSPAANALLLLFVTAWDHVTFANVPAISSIAGNGLTWTEYGAARKDEGGLFRASVYYAQGASPSTGAVTVTWDRTCLSTLHLVQVTGAAIGNGGLDAIVQMAYNDSDSATSVTATLAAYGSATSRPVAFAEGENPNTSVGDGDFTTLGNLNQDGGSYDINTVAAYSATQDTTFTPTQGSASFIKVWVFEIEEEPAAGISIPVVQHFRQRVF